MTIKRTLETVLLGIGIAGTLYRFGRAFNNAYETGKELGSAYSFLSEAKREMEIWQALNKLSKEDNITEMKRILDKTKSPAKESLLKKIGLYETSGTSTEEIKNAVNQTYFDTLLAYERDWPQWEHTIEKYEEQLLGVAMTQSFIHTLLYGTKRFEDIPSKKNH